VSKSGHHTSHRALLRKADLLAPVAASLDGIVVPSARPSRKLLHAAELARRHRCPLIVLASKQARRKEIVGLRQAARIKNFHVVDVPPIVSALPTFETTRMLRKKGLSRRTDVSTKRNVGLVVARMAGLRRVLLLDDDVTVERSRHLRVAAGLLSFNHAVGLNFEGMPDNSVVCHARREVGYRQDTFIGAGALVVATDTVDSFFPDIYNEDWFFLLDGERLRPVTRTGSAFQRRYDPFASEDRARAEEFGDVLAEGIFSLLDNGKTVEAADDSFWLGFIDDRHVMIEDISAAVSERVRDRSKRERMIRSLTASREQLIKYVTPNLCTEFIRAWRSDLERWRTFLTALPTGKLSIRQSFEYLNLHEQWAPSLRSLVSTRDAIAGQSRRKLLATVWWARHHVQMEQALQAQLHRAKVVVVLLLVLLVQLRSQQSVGQANLLRILWLSLQQQLRPNRAPTLPR
jgi:hypothetical protein